VTMREFRNILIENENMIVAVDPFNGGKICSLIDKRSGFELFYKDTRNCFNSHNGYSHHDISGMDECFPTVSSCIWPMGSNEKFDCGDHGLLWNVPWQVETDTDVMTMNCAIQSLGVEFERKCAFADAETLHLNYTIRNFGTAPVQYLYSAHPLLAVNEETVLELPHGIERAYFASASLGYGIAHNSWVRLPLSHHEDLVGPYNHAKGSYVKAFLETKTDSKVTVFHPGRRCGLEFSWDTVNLPYAGIFISHGFDSLNDGKFRGKLLLGVEPTSGIGDDLFVCEKTQTLTTVFPAQIVRFWIAIRLLHT
jgi:hypothetical protein